MYTSDGSIVQPNCSDPSHPPTPVSHEPASNETRSHAIAKMPPPVRHSMTTRQQSGWWSQTASLRPCRTAFFSVVGLCVLMTAMRMAFALLCASMAAARMAFHMDARMAFHVPTVLPFSVAMSDEHELQLWCTNAVSDAATSATNVDAATSAIDVHMLVPVTPKYKSSLPLSVSLHIINQREHMHCILISDQ
jgi:hypothetical protein